MQLSACRSQADKSTLPLIVDIFDPVRMAPSALDVLISVDVRRPMPRVSLSLDERVGYPHERSVAAHAPPQVKTHAVDLRSGYPLDDTPVRTTTSRFQRQVLDLVPDVSVGPMKKAEDSDLEMRPEYDFSKGVRGKYAKQYAEESNVVVLDPDVAAEFKTSKAVNEALRKQIAEQRGA